MITPNDINCGDIEINMQPYAYVGEQTQKEEKGVCKGVIDKLENGEVGIEVINELALLSVDEAIENIDGGVETQAGKELTVNTAIVMLRAIVELAEPDEETMRLIFEYPELTEQILKEGINIETAIKILRDIVGLNPLEKYELLQEKEAYNIISNPNGGFDIFNIEGEFIKNVEEKEIKGTALIILQTKEGKFEIIPLKDGNKILLNKLTKYNVTAQAYEFYGDSPNHLMEHYNKAIVDIKKAYPGKRTEDLEETHYIMEFLNKIHNYNVYPCGEDNKDEEKNYNDPYGSPFNIPKDKIIK